MVVFINYSTFTPWICVLGFSLSNASPDVLMEFQNLVLIPDVDVVVVIIIRAMTQVRAQ